MAAIGYSRVKYTDRQYSNPLARQLARLMEEKRSNICVAADVQTMQKVLEIAEQTGPYIVALKTHIDTYDDFSEEKVKELQALAAKHRFYIFEDRKFLDIGNTVKMQFTGGIFKISRWAHFVNTTIVPGSGILTALRQGMQETADRISEIAVLLLAEMSSTGNLFNRFLPETKEAADSAKDIVAGFIAQQSLGDDSFLHFVPGINALSKGDALDQNYSTPEEAIQRGADILIIGRGIYGTTRDPATLARAYQEAGWSAHESRIG